MAPPAQVKETQQQFINTRYHYLLLLFFPLSSLLTCFSSSSAMKDAAPVLANGWFRVLSKSCYYLVASGIHSHHPHFSLSFLQPAHPSTLIYSSRQTFLLSVSYVTPLSLHPCFSPHTCMKISNNSRPIGLHPRFSALNSKK